MTTTLNRYRDQRSRRRDAAFRLMGARHSQSGRVVREEQQHFATALLHSGRA